MKEQDVTKAQRIDKPVSLPRGKYKHTLQKRLFTLQEAGQYLAKSNNAVKHLVWRGDLPTVRKNERAKIYFDLQDLDRWIEKHKTTDTY